MPRTHCANFTTLPSAGSGLRPVSSLNFYFLSWAHQVYSYLFHKVPKILFLCLSFIQQIFIITDSNNSLFCLYNTKASMSAYLSDSREGELALFPEKEMVSERLSDVPRWPFNTEAWTLSISYALLPPTVHITGTKLQRQKTVVAPIWEFTFINKYSLRSYCVPEKRQAWSLCLWSLWCRRGDRITQLCNDTLDKYKVPYEGIE